MKHYARIMSPRPAPEPPPEQVEGPLWHFCILRDSNNQIHIGYVVTHLAIEDWCAWHGYRLVQLRHTRPAFLAGRPERTKIL